jgi:acyl-CoA thioester hydrolase
MSAKPKSRDSYRVWTTDNIRYSDLDPNGHVNNGAMNAFLEDGRVRFRQEHLSAVAADTLAGFVVVKFSVEYHAPLYYPGDVDIGTAVSRVGTTSYGLRQALFTDQLCVASAEVVTVSIDTATAKPKPFSESWRALFESFLVDFD